MPEHKATLAELNERIKLGPIINGLVSKSLI